MKKLIILAIAILLVSGCSLTANKSLNSKSIDLGTTINKEELIGKKILFVDSYHEGYEWSDGTYAGIANVLKDTGVELKVYRMDTKNNPSEEFRVSAGVLAKSVADEFQPDLIIISDDNAFAYFVQRYYKNVETPVVYCGINWDASVYGAPYTNTTGMLEVSLTNRIIEMLKPYAKGDRIGFISGDTETEHKNEEYYKKLLNIDFTKIYYALDFATWKEKFEALQTEVDLIIFENNAGIARWDDELAKNFVANVIKVPVGTTNAWVMPVALLGITKIPGEQGEWAAQTALEILSGTAPNEIEEAYNKQGELLVNLDMAENLNIVMNANILKRAKIVK